MTRGLSKLSRREFAALAAMSLPGAAVEFEYPGDPLVEMPKCLQYCKDALK